MSAAKHTFNAMHADPIDQRPVSGEYETFRHIVFSCAEQRRRIGIEHDGIGTLGNAGRLPAAFGGRFQQKTADRGLFFAGGDITLLVLQALSVLQPTQFLGHRHRHIGIGSDGEPAFCFQEIGQGKKTVAQIGFGTGTNRHRRL